MRTTLGLSLVAVLIPLDPGYAATASANIVSATPVLGDGYSDIDGIARASCLSNVGKVIDPSGSGGTATVRLVTHTESLRKVLNLSASATFGIGIYSGSADANYVESTNLSKYNSVIIVRVSQNTGTERLGTPMRLSRDPVRFSLQKGPSRSILLSAVLPDRVCRVIDKSISPYEQTACRSTFFRSSAHTSPTCAAGQSRNSR